MCCGIQDLVKFALSMIKASCCSYFYNMFFKIFGNGDVFRAYKTSPTPTGRRSPKTLHILSSGSYEEMKRFLYRKLYIESFEEII